jgi:hypothetical protein
MVNDWERLLFDFQVPLVFTDSVGFTVDWADWVSADWDTAVWVFSVECSEVEF